MFVCSFVVCSSRTFSVRICLNTVMVVGREIKIKLSSEGVLEIGVVYIPIDIPT